MPLKAFLFCFMFAKQTIHPVFSRVQHHPLLCRKYLFRSPITTKKTPLRCLFCWWQVRGRVPPCIPPPDCIIGMRCTNIAAGAGLNALRCVCGHESTAAVAAPKRVSFLLFDVGGVNLEARAHRVCGVWPAAATHRMKRREVRCGEYEHFFQDSISHSPSSFVSISVRTNGGERYGKQRTERKRIGKGHRRRAH